MPEVNAAQWDSFLARRSEAHLLQTTAWGELKSEFGWTAVRILSAAGCEPETGAQILFRRLPLGYSIAYIPRGPVGSNVWNEACNLSFWSEVELACRQRRAIFLKVEPDLWEQPNLASLENKPLSVLRSLGFQPSAQSIQPQRTIVIDISGDEECVLGNMKQKTRYNIRLSLKKGVVVHPSADLETFHRLMQVTGGRDGFGVHSLKYYRTAYDLFHPRGACELLIADYQGEALAGLMVFTNGPRAWYLYGASASDHRERMPSYILQWEAMRWARVHGCKSYDLWGIPDVEEQDLEENFTERSGGLWGVYRFKRGFGGLVCRSAGPLDRIYQPVLYRLYNRYLRLRGGMA